MDVIDWFCGAGGSSTGLVAAGYTVRVAANHSPVAVATHAANHPDTEHLCADVSAIDLRRLPRTRCMWASPICTEISPAGGRQRRRARSPLTAPPLPDGDRQPEGGLLERTRVTFWEVVRAAEIYRHDAIMIENVVEAADWELFPEWLNVMTKLGYSYQLISVNAAHVGGTHLPAPQWRDRLYIALLRHGITAHQIEPRPAAHCPQCGPVQAIQAWRPGHKHAPLPVGKYKRQYDYACPECRTQVEPGVIPAADAIDWTNLGHRLGDRKRPLAAGTMRRIQTGLDMVAAGTLGAPSLVSTHHDGNGRHRDPWTHPHATITAKNSVAAATPFIAKTYGGYAEHQHMIKPVQEPLPTVRGTSSDALVVPFRRGSAPHTPGLPLSTMTTRQQHGLMRPAADLDDVRFRMLTPRESACAQRFPSNYILTGTQGEQQLQAGNAVAVNVAEWIGRQVAEILDGAA